MQEQDPAETTKSGSAKISVLNYQKQNIKQSCLKK